MTVEEIKLRRLKNQYLITPSDKTAVVRDLCGIQSQFMVNVFHSLKIRTSDYDEQTVGDGLVKNWTVRGTVHVFAEGDLPLFIRCNDGRDYRKNEWSGYRFWNQREKWALTPERQKYLSDVIIGAVAEGPKTRAELKSICQKHGMTPEEEGSMFDQWGGGIRELCERGFMNYIVSEEKAYCLSPEFTPVSEAEAKLELARRYFTHFAPATVHDAMYYFHATAAEVKKWLSLLPVVSVECGGRTYYYIENGRSYDCDIPECVFLAGFDQLMLGYEKKESLFLPQEYMRLIFNLAGIVMPSVLYRGDVIGKWKLKNGKFSAELFGSVDTDAKKAIKTTAETLWDNIKKIEIKQI